MNLMLFSSEEETWYKIADNKYFEEEMDIEDLKNIYYNAIIDIRAQNILDKLEKEGKIESSLSKEDREKEKFDWDCYRYTKNYISNILKSKMSIIEYKTFIEWCMTKLLILNNEE